jgi:thiosulfate dehydrogenase
MRKFLLGFAAGLLAPLVVGVVISRMGLLPVDAKAAPPAWEAALAMPALDASVARHAPHIANPVAADEANLLEGVKLYKTMCAGCHGDPNGESSFGAGFYPPAPQFASHPPDDPDWHTFWIVKNGIRYTGMPSWENQLGKGGDEKIWKMASFLSHLNSLPPSVNTEWHKKPAQ